MPVNFPTSMRLGLSPNKRTPRAFSIGRDGEFLYASIYAPDNLASGWDIYIDPDEVIELLVEHGYLRRIENAYVVA